MSKVSPEHQHHHRFAAIPFSPEARHHLEEVVDIPKQVAVKAYMTVANLIRGLGATSFAIIYIAFVAR